MAPPKAQNGVMPPRPPGLRAVFALWLGVACGRPVTTTAPAVPDAFAFPQSRAGMDLIGQSILADLDVRWPDAPLLEAGTPGPPATLVRFWTDTCPFCRASLPALEELRKEFLPRGFRTLGVYHPKPPRPSTDADVRSAAEELGYHGPLAIDEQWSALKAIWLESGRRSATSFSILLDGAGRVRFVHPGPEFHPSTDADHALCNSDFSDLRLAIEQLLVEAE